MQISALAVVAVAAVASAQWTNSTSNATVAAGNASVAATGSNYTATNGSAATLPAFTGAATSVDSSIMMAVAGAVAVAAYMA
ncbi:hypothetical protein YB2330_004882 [Saitoella coloradoensis]